MLCAPRLAHLHSACTARGFSGLLPRAKPNEEIEENQVKEIIPNGTELGFIPFTKSQQIFYSIFKIEIAPAKNPCTAR
jgi:hypothetical protein